MSIETLLQPVFRRCSPFPTLLLKLTQTRQHPYPSSFKLFVLQMGARQSSSKSTTQPSAHTSSSVRNIDPHNYTSGHWLQDDELQRRSRFVDFDFATLCKKAVDVCAGAHHVSVCEKKEGAFNRTFLMVLDNGKKVVARVPFSVAGPPRNTTHSEVATMSYLQAKTSIPIPKVLAWCDDASNPVGCEYIIMEHVEGVQLHERWPTMNSLQRMLCVKKLGMIARDMANLAFPAYGSIYFADSSDLPTSGLDLGDGFCLGPNCGTVYWDSSVGEAELYGQKNLNKGPWLNISEYCAGLIDAGRSRIPEVENKISSLRYRGSRDDHIQLLAESKAVLKQLIEFPPIQEAALPTLFHYDFHKRNIYVSDVDPTIVTGIIDWQSTSVEPGFIYANEIPDFTTYNSESPFTDPATKGQPASLMSDKQSREREDAKICSKTYEVILKGLAKKLGSGRALDETLLRPFYYAATSTRDSAAAVRQGLIEVSQRWEELGLPGSCSYRPSPRELEEHQKDYEDFETAQKLKLWLMAMLNTTSDGWVPCEAWESALEANRAAFNEWMRSAAESEDMDSQKARDLWPFNEMGPI